MAQVARANNAAVGGDPRKLKRLAVQFRGMGFPEQEITVTGTVVEERDGRAGGRHGGRAERQPDHPQRAGGNRSLSHNTGVEITPRQTFILRKVVEGHLELETPVGSKWLAEQADVPWGPSTMRAEMARLEEAGLLEHPHTSAGRIPTDRGYRHYVDGLLVRGLASGAAAAARAERPAPRGRRGDARHHRAALAGDRPPGARLGAAGRDRHDPPRRGPAAPAAGGDGGGDHLDRRRDQARGQLRAPARPGPRGLGRAAT